MVIYMGLFLSFIAFSTTMFSGLAIGLIKNTRLSLMLNCIVAVILVMATWNLVTVFNIDDSYKYRWILMIVMEIIGFATGWLIGHHEKGSQEN